MALCAFTMAPRALITCWIASEPAMLSGASSMRILVRMASTSPTAPGPAHVGTPPNLFIHTKLFSPSVFIMPVNGGEDDCQWIDVNGLPSHRLAIFSLRYSPTGDKIIGGSNNSTVIVTDIRTRNTQILRTHRMPGKDVNSVCFLHDKDPNVIIAGCDDGLLKVYDLRTTFRSRDLSKSVASFIGHYDGITYIDSRNDGYHVLSNSKDQSIKIWDIRQPSNMRNRSRSRQQVDPTTWDYRWNRVPRECKLVPVLFLENF